MVKKDFAFLTYGFNTLDVDFAVLFEARSPRTYYGLGFVKKDLAVGTLNIIQILDLPYSKPTHACVETIKPGGSRHLPEQ